MKKKTLLLLLGIFVLSFILRVYKLAEFPVGLHIDEAQIGYNAYSLLKTGRDEFGNFLPHHLNIFDSGRPMGLFYLAIPSIAFLGLNEFAVRFPSAFFGTLTVLVTYFLVKELFFSPSPSEESLRFHFGPPRRCFGDGHPWGGVGFSTSEESRLRRATIRGDIVIALLASFLLAISPWHIIFSRSGIENILELLSVLIGIFFLFHGLRKKKKLSFLLAYFFFLFAYFSYMASRIFVPLLLLGFGVIFLRELLTQKLMKAFIFASILYFIFPFGIFMLKSESMSRFTQIGLFTNPGVQLEIDEQIREDKSLPPFLTRSFHNKLLNHSLAFLKNYQEYFTGKFLFIEGGFPLRFKVPQTGVLYLIELPFLLIGLFSFLKERKKEQLFILSWLFAGPIAASLTIEDVPNFQRALITLPAFVILISYGIFQSLNFVKNKRYIILALIIIISFYLYSLLFFLHQYFVHQKVHRPWYRMYEMKELVSEVTKRESRYQKIIMTKDSTEPYIFFLFYQKTNPADYQKEAYKLSWKKNWTLGKYEFMVDDCPLQIDDVEKNAGYLYIEKEECLKYRWKKTVKQIKRTDGTVALKLLEVDLPEYQKWKKLGNKLYKELYEK